MSRLLLTAFEPDAHWTMNSSWQALIELTKNLPSLPEVTTRRYPANFLRLRERLETDVKAAYDAIVLLGQAAGAPCLTLETIALNVGLDRNRVPRAGTLAEDGPTAYSSSMPLEQYAAAIREQGIPARVSFHAGVDHGNAAFYWVQHLAARQKLNTQVTLVRIPLNEHQAREAPEPVPYMATASVATALRAILQAIAERPTQPPLS